MADGIAVHQLRRITFLEDLVILEGVGNSVHIRPKKGRTNLAQAPSAMDVCLGDSPAGAIAGPVHSSPQP